MNQPTTTRQRLEAREEDIRSCLAALVPTTAPNIVLSGAADGAFHLVSSALKNTEPVLDEQKMRELKDKLKFLRISTDSLPVTDPRLMPADKPRPGLDQFLNELREIKNSLWSHKDAVEAATRQTLRTSRQLTANRQAIHRLHRLAAR